MSQDREREGRAKVLSTRLRIPADPSLGAVGAGSNAGPHFVGEKEFPDDFCLTLKKVHGSDPYIIKSGGGLVINKPQHFGDFTNKYVYGPLKNGEVLKELQRLNPKIAATGTRREKLHQFLTKGYGPEELRE